MGFTSEQARAAAKKQARVWTEDEITTGLMALVAWAGNASAASRYLASEKQLKVSASTLNHWKQSRAGRLDELRTKYAGQLEENLSHEYRDVARLAVEGVKEEIAAARKLMEDGEEKDPARAAANLARVAQTSTDKLLSLTGRPTQITENRNTEEILRSLIARGVLQPPEEKPQLEETTG